MNKTFELDENDLAIKLIELASKEYFTEKVKELKEGGVIPTEAIIKYFLKRDMKEIIEIAKKYQDDFMKKFENSEVKESIVNLFYDKITGAN